MTTLDAHLAADRQPGAGEVGALVRAVAAAGVRIADELARAVLIGQLGTTGETNVQGEQVKKLEGEQKTLSTKVEELMAEWERIETEMAELGVPA